MTKPGTIDARTRVPLGIAVAATLTLCGLVARYTSEMAAHLQRIDDRLAVVERSLHIEEHAER